MDKKIFTDETIDKYRNIHRILQVTIAIVSNHRLGVDIFNSEYRVRAIFKMEGGVVANNKEIVIAKRDGIIYCYNDWDNKEVETSRVVKQVIEELLSLQFDGDQEGAKVLVKYAVENTNNTVIFIPNIEARMNRFLSNSYSGNTLFTLFKH